MTVASYRICLLVGFLAALLVRMVSLPSSGFFCDVPAQVNCIDSGRYLIQFPGYAPFHLLAGLLTRLTASTWESLLLISLVCWALSTIYVVRTADLLQGHTAALLSGCIMMFTIFPIYFSVAGTSYLTDMLFVAGMLYHGFKRIQEPDATKHYWAIAGWLGFGILMRPLSAMWSLPALLLLDGWSRHLGRMILSVILMGAAGLIYILLSLPFYGSLTALIDASLVVSGALHHYTLSEAASNLFRIVTYPMYGLHLWLIVCLVVLLQHWRNLRDRKCIFAVSLVLPYFLVLLRYIPHAGYYCLLLPVVAVLPWTLAAPPRLAASPLLPGLLVGMSLLQLFLVRPIPTTGLPSGVANAYFLQYSQAGLKEGYFETLASAMFKAGGASRQLVPENRWYGSHNPQAAPRSSP